jgi:hypothetical protein
MRKIIFVISLLVLICIIIFISGRVQQKSEGPIEIRNQNISGEINQDQIWSGEILVTENVIVPEGVTLIIESNTVIKFKHYRGYKEPWRRIGLSVEGGTLKAVGTPEKQIWFTSDASDPINGDWQGISLMNTDNSEFNYVIVEFGEIGVEQFDSSVSVKNSIIRWSNSEGLYAERSKPIFINNTLYENGYHEIALEQYNENVQIKNNIFRNSKGLHWAIHHEKTSSIIEGNFFSGYSTHNVITAGMESRVTIKNNKFSTLSGFAAEKPIDIYDGSTAEIENNDFENDSVSVEIPIFDYQDIRNYDLDYVPGDIEDRYLYIYPDDETRKTIKKIGKNLGFGFALVYADGYLWRFSIGSGLLGIGQDFIRIDPETEEITRFGSNEFMNPRGLAYDGQFFYVNDFSLLKIFKFKLNSEAKEGDFVEIVDEFDIPEKELGGTMALTSDGNFLYHKSRDGSKLYKINKEGQILDEIKFENPGVAMQCLVWTGEYFWTCGGCEKGLCKFTKDGKLAGEIYPPAKDTWALAYDGKYLWSIQRTSETWDDPKIYQIEILDDSIN